MRHPDQRGPGELEYISERTMCCQIEWSCEGTLVLPWRPRQIRALRRCHVLWYNLTLEEIVQIHVIQQKQRPRPILQNRVLGNNNSEALRIYP
jgi:hypothetical protein